MKCIILAGGLGTRLRSVVPDCPKCMAPVAGKPFLQYILDDLQAKGFDRIVLSLGYKHEIIEKWLSKLKTSADISFIVENTPLGTGGAVKLSMARMAVERKVSKKITDAEENEVFVLNGDTFFDVNFNAMLALHRKCCAQVTIALKQMSGFDRFGKVDFDAETNKISNFEEKKYCKEGLINAGVYLLNRNSLDSYPESFSLEQDYFEKIAPLGNVYGYAADAEKYFIDIGIPEDYEKAKADFSNPETMPCIAPYSQISADDDSAKPLHPVFDALFLDRDGVINKQIEGGYVRNAAQFVFLDGSLEALKVMSQFFRRIIVITNQRGVGKGIMSRIDLMRVNSYMVKKVKEAGGRIDKIYSCTDIDENSPDRKPNTGMALMAKRDYPDVDFKKSLMVGDSISDIDFANKAGIPAILVGDKYAREEISDLHILAKYGSLLEMSVKLFASLK